MLINIYPTRRGTFTAWRQYRDPSTDTSDLATSMGHEPKMFNLLPKEIRNIKNCSQHKFTGSLDTFLRPTSDELPVPDFTARSRATTNSIPYLTKRPSPVAVYSEGSPQLCGVSLYMINQTMLHMLSLIIFDKYIIKFTLH